ncbi:unnamed protein product [Chilo suppressalis]|uniref:V-SNARE coiled-coil homology domain-containing protein n=1 Tax=Chilo suppressalis TaxID=168631 RepID=A0ABN8L455_CHISP|nr:unnamed protein product [Chilo suppressalis]
MQAEVSGGPPVPEEPQTGPDGEIIGGPRTHQQIAAQKRMQQTKAQVDEVVDIMKTNYEKVLERDVKLSELDDRADALEYGASQFEQQAKSLKNKFWLQNLKMMIIMGIIGLVIIGLLYLRYSGSSSPVSAAPAAAAVPAGGAVAAPGAVAPAAASTAAPAGR